MIQDSDNDECVFENEDDLYAHLVSIVNTMSYAQLNEHREDIDRQIQLFLKMGTTKQ